MFENIGCKIKKLAKYFAYACVICGVFAVAIGLTIYLSEADYLEYATVYGGSGFSTLTKAGNAAWTGLQMLKYGPIAAAAGFLSAWPLYGFGELIENVTVIADNTKRG